MKMVDVGKSISVKRRCFDWLSNLCFCTLITITTINCKILDKSNPEKYRILESLAMLISISKINDIIEATINSITEHMA